MKKLIVFLMSVVIVALATSCNQKSHHLQPDLKISVKLDTTIMYPVPKTSPLWTCDGKRAGYDKLLSMDSVPLLVSLSKDTIISGKNLPESPVVAKTKPTKKAGSGFDFGWLWPILSFLLGALLVILALALLVWVLLWLIRQFANQTGGSNPNDPEQQNQQHNVAPVVPVTPVVPGGGDTKTRTNLGNPNIFNHQLLMVNNIAERQNIHKVSQTTRYESDGSWESEVVIETKNNQPPIPKEEVKKEN